MTNMAEAGYLGKRRTRAQWSQVVKDFSDSGLSVSKYCEQIGISESNFYRWRSLLASAPKVAVRKSTRRVMAPDKGFVDLGPLDSVPVNSPVGVLPDARIDLRLEFGGGLVLTVSRG
jgi:Transposase